MAHMIPPRPRNYVPSSEEGIIFDALEKLPSDYWVVHSYRFLNIDNDKNLEREIDFVVFNKSKGFLCIEAKHGRIYSEEGLWFYENGDLMPHSEGPFVQASTAKHELMNKIKKNQTFRDIIKRCTFRHAVWMHSYERNEIEKNLKLPESDSRLVLTKDDLKDPTKTIENIFDIPFYKKNPDGQSFEVKTNLSDNEGESIINQIICPKFKILSAAKPNIRFSDIIFYHMLEEQSRVLDFLVGQRSVAICGAAGTGKTLLAVEESKRLSMDGKKVLYLCFNQLLRNELFDSYKIPNVEFYTISKFCREKTGNFEDYDALNELLFEQIVEKQFPYDAVIIDEGQDFGIRDIEKSDILKTLREGLLEIEDSVFYIFYDRMQCVHNSDLPSVIDNCDSKITLYKNCRNTKHIGQSSINPLDAQDKKRITFLNELTGDAVNLHFCNSDNVISKIDELIKKYKDSKTIILTCATETTSCIANYIQKDKDYSYYNKTKFTTCRKFKGLEADTVILLDITPETFKGENKQLFYVGSSRAKLNLEMITMMNDDDCLIALQNLDCKKIRQNKLKLSLALELKANYIENN
jgi:hypothetical protein